MQLSLSLKDFIFAFSAEEKNKKCLEGHSLSESNRDEVAAEKKKEFNKKTPLYSKKKK